MFRTPAQAIHVAVIDTYLAACARSIESDMSRVAIIGGSACRPLATPPGLASGAH